MATVLNGVSDSAVQAIKAALDAYEATHEGAVATLYRHNPASVRVRIIDQRFASMSKSQRHNEVWRFIAELVPEDVLSDISVVLTLAPSEVDSSLMNREFETPMPFKF
jgi:stress-induced morphogen